MPEVLSTPRPMLASALRLRGDANGPTRLILLANGLIRTNQRIIDIQNAGPFQVSLGFPPMFVRKVAWASVAGPDLRTPPALILESPIFGTLAMLRAPGAPAIKGTIDYFPKDEFYRGPSRGLNGFLFDPSATAPELRGAYKTPFP